MVAKDRDKDSSNGIDIASLGDLWDLAVLDVADTGERLDSLLGLLTSLWISESLEVLLQSRHELWQEGSDDVWILDKLAHVVDNDSSLTLDWGVALSETTLEQWNHDGERWLVDVSDESGGTKKVDSLWDVLRLGDTLDELWDEALDILVDDQAANLLHGSMGSLLDLWLGIPHGLGDDRDQVWHAVSELDWGGSNEEIDALQANSLFRPLDRGLERVQDEWENSLDRVGADSLDDGKSSSSGGVLDRDLLVTNRWKDDSEKVDEVSLDSRSDRRMLSDGLDGLNSMLASSGVLLVGKLGLEMGDDPDENVRTAISKRDFDDGLT